MCLVYIFCKYGLRSVIDATEVLPTRIKRAWSKSMHTDYFFPRRQIRMLLFYLDKKGLYLSIEAKSLIHSFLPPPEFCLWSKQNSGHLLRVLRDGEILHHLRAQGSRYSTGSQNGIAKCKIPSTGVHSWEVRYVAKYGQLDGGNCVGIFVGEPPHRMLIPGDIDLCDFEDSFYGIHESLFLEEDEEEERKNSGTKLYDSGDIVRVTLDRKLGKMVFSCNGKLLNVKIENIPHSDTTYIVCSPYMRETLVRLKHIRSEF